MGDRRRPPRRAAGSVEASASTAGRMMRSTPASAVGQYGGAFRMHAEPRNSLGWLAAMHGWLPLQKVPSQPASRRRRCLPCRRPLTFESSSVASPRVGHRPLVRTDTSVDWGDRVVGSWRRPAWHWRDWPPDQRPGSLGRLDVARVPRRPATQRAIARSVPGTRHVIVLGRSQWSASPARSSNTPSSRVTSSRPRYR